MKYAKTSTWVGGAVFLAVVLIAFAWFFAIGPVREEAKTDFELAEQTRQENEILALENVKLAKQFENLDEYKAELAEHRTRIQDTIDQADFNRELDKLSQSAKGTVVDVSFQTSIELTEVAGAPTGLFAIPVNLTVVGSPEAALDYVDQLQQETDRLFFVSTLSSSAQDQAGATGGRPASAQGDLEISITGYIYTLNPERATQEAEPEPDSGSNEGEGASEEVQAT